MGGRHAAPLRASLSRPPARTYECVSGAHPAHARGRRAPRSKGRLARDRATPVRRALADVNARLAAFLDRHYHAAPHASCALRSTASTPRGMPAAVASQTSLMPSPRPRSTPSARCWPGPLTLPTLPRTCLESQLSPSLRLQYEASHLGARRRQAVDPADQEVPRRRPMRGDRQA